jgi:large subunit ribosomal protein L7/L12
MNSTVNATVKQEANAIEEKTEFDVVIESVQAAKRLNVIKVIRTITSLGLKEAKDLIESLPKVVLQGVSKEKAEETKKLLEEAGAAITLK